MDSQQLTTLITEMNTKLYTLKKLEERMDKRDKKIGQITDWQGVLHCWRKFNPTAKQPLWQHWNQPNRSNTQTPSHKNDIKVQSLEREQKGPEFPKISFTNKLRL